MPAPIAVTGSTGGLGGRVARTLAERAIPQRLIVRDATRAPDLPGAEVVEGDYARPRDLVEVLHGVETLFLVSGHEARGRVALHARVIEAAVDAGVRRVVYTSFLNAAPDATFTFARDHAATEELLEAEELTWVGLRSSTYQDILPSFVGEDRMIRGPAGHGRVSFVARDDIAEVGVACLLDADAASGPIDVTGPVALSFDEVARVLTEVTGRRIGYHAETLDEARASRGPTGAPDWEIEGWVTSYHAATTGELATVSDTVRQLTGRPPVDLVTWLRREPTTWAHLRAR